MGMKLKWKTVLLKLSGEAMGGKGQLGLDVDALRYIAQEIRTIHRMGCRIGIVIGGGNFIRGQKLADIGIDRTTADYMGMLGTVMNALALQDVLERAGMNTRVQSSLAMIQVAEPFIRRKAIRHLEKGRIVIFSGGTGNPYFSTDTAAALRASEINADAILKATNVRGVFQEDPKKNAKAKFLPQVDAIKMLQQGMRVMDLTAISFSMEHKIPVIVFDVFKKGNLTGLLRGKKIGSEIINGAHSRI